MFKPYCHIENAYQGDEVQKIRAAGLGGTPCVCTAKVDGCNFQVAVAEDGSVSFGTRNRELQPDESFSGWQRVMERYGAAEKARELKKLLGAPELVVFGELCGGLYRHPDVAKAPEAVRIQGRIDYSPENEWLVFDALAGGEWVGQWKLREACGRVGLPCVKIMFSGTFEECLKFPCEYLDVTGHELWGLPVIEGNVGEGVVIKSAEDVRLPGGGRLVLKNKNPKYKERIRATKERSSQARGGASPLEAQWAGRLEELLTESRAWSALSKLGSEASFGDLAKAVMEDAVAELMEESGAELEAAERTADPKDFSFKKARKLASKALVEAVRPVWLQARRSE